MLSVSPSIVGSFEYWRSLEDGDYADSKLAELVAQIKGEPFEPTAAMLLGRAFHSALEGEAVEGYEFDPASVTRVAVGQPEGLIREPSGTLLLPEINVLMRLRVDGVDGNEIHEVKTTEKPLDPDEYMNAMQWKCYLLAFEAQSVVYHLCRLHQDRDSGVYSVADYARLHQYAYPGMREDVLRRVGDCAQFIVDQGLSHYREIEPKEIW